MRPALEDILMAKMASPSFSQGVHFDGKTVDRRVRTVFGGVTIG